MFWSLGFLLALVPLLAKVSLPIETDTKFPYLAALFVAAASGLKVVFRPLFAKYESLSSFRNDGWTLDTLRDAYSKVGGEFGADSEFDTFVENKAAGRGPNCLTSRASTSLLSLANDKMRLSGKSIHLLPEPLFLLPSV